MSSPVTAHTAVAVEPPCIPVAAVARAVEQQYGLSGAYTPLVSERDQNFRLHVQSGGDYVVKVASSAEAAIVSEFQTEALRHLQQFTTVTTPEIVLTIAGRSSGTIDHATTQHKLRLVSFVDGEPLSTVQMDCGMAHDFGAKLAALDRALDGFSHAGEHPVLLWDLQRAAELSDLLGHIDDPSIRASVSSAIKDFERLVLPKIDSLRSQVIHGDANPENVLIDVQDRRVSGFIDFGDMVRAPLVFDVAIAASYLRTEETDALLLIAPFIAAYHTSNPLSTAELALLFDLVRARLATTITLLHWRLGARDSDDAYRQKTQDREADAMTFLSVLDRLGRAGFARRLERELPPRPTRI